MAGLLTSPSARAFSKETRPSMAKNAALIRMTQLRAQSRNHTGFPFELAGETSGRSTIIRCKVTLFDGYMQISMEKWMEMSTFAKCFWYEC